MSAPSSVPGVAEPSEDLIELARKSSPPDAAPLSDPSTRANVFLRFLDDSWQKLERLVQRWLPHNLNPLNQFGAIANTCLMIAVVSGIALLFWYSPSVHQAHASLELLRTSFLGQLVRSIHRYSSDGCLFFVLLHAFRIVAQRRFTGARWLAWTTGAVLLGLLWFIGWTGYWLVWDVRGQHTALGTARFFDSLPIFTEPLSRSFLTDQSVPSLFFFLIFFAHMLTPLAMGVGLWMHLMRVNRARFLASTQMTLWIGASLVALSLLAPSFSAAPAQMTVKTAKFTIDWWYLWPLALTDRLGGGALWGIFSLGGLAFLSVPWTMARRRLNPPKAEVELPRCIGCSLCAKDCPFNAITMIPREDGRKFEVQSSVNPALCVSCGICTGACDSQAINLPVLNSRSVEKELQQWIQGQTAMGKPAFIAFCCGESAGSLLKANQTGVSDLLPGYRIQNVPCVGWVSAVMLERLLRNGASGILVVGCGHGDPVFREGMKWFDERLQGSREPKFDARKADPTRVLHVKFNRGEAASLAAAAAEFRVGSRRATAHPRPKLQGVAVGVALALFLSFCVWSLSDLSYTPPHHPSPELIVSFNHAGAILEPKKLTREELEKRLPHMRAQVNVSRQRAAVRLRVTVDRAVVFLDSFAPRGLQNDGPSIAVARLPVTAGKHFVEVALADTADPDQWTKTWSAEVEFKENENRVVLFDSKAGFTLH